jgi:hypothetical protein
MNFMDSLVALGPVPNTQNPDSTLEIWILSVGAVLIVVLYVRELRRNQALRRGAAERGLQWIGQALPRYVPDRLLPHDGRLMSISNAFAGSIHGTEFICCDCILGQGKRRTWVTLVGVRSYRDPYAVRHLYLSLDSREVNGWFGLTLSKANWFSKKLMIAEQVFSIIDNTAETNSVSQNR